MDQSEAKINLKNQLKGIIGCEENFQNFEWTSLKRERVPKINQGVSQRPCMEVVSCREGGSGRYGCTDAYSEIGVGER